MTRDLDQLLSERFARLAPEPGPPDWPDVLRRARPLGVPARPRWRRRTLAVAAAVLAAFAVAGAALALSGASTGVPAIDRLLDRASTHSEPARPGAPPYSDFHPRPGTVSKPLELRFDGIDYMAVGFRSRGGMICAAMVNPTAERANGGVGCASARLLQRSLEERRFFVSGGGGGTHAITYGFARAGVTDLALAADEGPGVVKLSEPWRAGRGKPIRFFYAISDAPAEPRARLPYQRIIEARP